MQAAAAQYQPGLIAVPDRRELFMRCRARARMKQREQNPETQIESIHDDVREDRQCHDRAQT